MAPGQRLPLGESTCAPQRRQALTAAETRQLAALQLAGCHGCAQWWQTGPAAARPCAAGLRHSPRAAAQMLGSSGGRLDPPLPPNPPAGTLAASVTSGGVSDVGDLLSCCKRQCTWSPSSITLLAREDTHRINDWKQPRCWSAAGSICLLLSGRPPCKAVGLCCLHWLTAKLSGRQFVSNRHHCPPQIVPQ